MGGLSGTWEPSVKSKKREENICKSGGILTNGPNNVLRSSCDGPPVRWVLVLFSPKARFTGSRALVQSPSLSQQEQGRPSEYTRTCSPDSSYCSQRHQTPALASCLHSATSFHTHNCLIFFLISEWAREDSKCLLLQICKQKNKPKLQEKGTKQGWVGITTCLGNWMLLIFSTSCPEAIFNFQFQSNSGCCPPWQTQVQG